MSKKYIDAEKAILEIEKHIRTGDEVYLLQIREKWCNEGLQLATDILYNQSAANVIEVVRCRYCRYNDLAGKDSANILCRKFYGSWQADDYCSYGERKDG